jgi:outer membrane protein
MDNKLSIMLYRGMLLFTMLWLGYPSTTAQQKYNLTADQAAGLALKNVTDIKNLQIDREIQLAKNREYIAQALPQINGNVQMQHFFSIPVTLLPDFVSPSVYQVLVDNGVKNGTGNPIVKPNNQAQFFPAQFGVPWQTSAGAQFQQLLFQPDLFIAIKARKKAIDFTDANIKVMEDSVKSSVYKAYYSVLIAEKRKHFLDESIKRLRKLKADQEKLYANGFAERLDIDKTQVTLNNLVTSASQIEKLIEIGYASMKFALAIEQKDTLELSDTLSVDLVKKDLLELTSFNYSDRKEIQLLNVVKDLQGLDIKRSKMAYLPTISTYWSYSQNALRQSFDFFDSNQRWFKTSVWGLNMNIPIVDGGQKLQRTRQANLNMQKTKNTIENVQRAIDLQLAASSIMFKNALSSLDMQERNVELAGKVYSTTKKKYEQGLGSSFELLQTETELESAQSNYFQSLYDAVNAKISYTKALGKL